MLSPRFFGIKTESSSLIIFQRARYQRGVLLIYAGAIEGQFEGKTQQKFHQGSLVLVRQCPSSPGTCKSDETGLPGLPMSWSLRIWPRRTTTCSLDWKTIERSPFFVRRWGHCCRGELVRRTTFWIVLSGLQKLEQRAKTVYWASCVVCWINTEFGRCSLFPYRSG